MNACVILARTDSRRLPGKALIEIGGKTILEYCIEGAKLVVDTITIVATSNREIDQPIEEIAKRNGVACFRGDAYDVSQRLLLCLEHFKVQRFARVNGDSPFVRPKLLNEAFVKSKSYDFVTNLSPRSFPYGVSAEVLWSDTFRESVANFDEAQKEHVTTYFYDHIEKFKYLNLFSALGDHQDIRLTIDTPEDLARFKIMVEILGIDIALVSLEKIITTYQKVFPIT